MGNPSGLRSARRAGTDWGREERESADVEKGGELDYTATKATNLLGGPGGVTEVMVGGVRSRAGRESTGDGGGGRLNKKSNFNTGTTMSKENGRCWLCGGMNCRRRSGCFRRRKGRGEFLEEGTRGT